MILNEDTSTTLEAKKPVFSYQDIGLALDSRECVVLQSRRGEIEEQRTPALAQVSGREIRAVGQRALRLVGKSNDIVYVFPGRIEDPLVLTGYLEIIVPPSSSWSRRRLWATVPTASSLQMQLNLRSCLDHSIRSKDIVLVPEVLAAALGAGLPVLRHDDDSHRARMVVHVGSTRIAAGVFVDGSLTSLVVRDGSWDRLVRDVQENLQFRLGTTFGFNTFHKVVRTLSKSFFDRQVNDAARIRTPPSYEIPLSPVSTASPGEAVPAQLEPAGEVLPEVSPPSNLRSFSERGLIEYVIEDATISRAIDVQLKNLIFAIEKAIFGCFAELKGAGRGEIASDLFSDRILLCGDVYFEPAALTRYFSRLTGFRFESVNGHSVSKGLRRILTSDPIHKKNYREIASAINEVERLRLSRI
ncbi:MAG: rod shape-determining protein [Vicinamibacteria bacterium]